MAHGIDEITPHNDKIESRQTAAICIFLGLFCLLFPILIETSSSGFMKQAVIIHMSVSVGFSLFITAVGGWATGVWQGWTLRGAAAMAVVIFLLLQYFSPAKIFVDAIEIQIRDTKLYKDITAIEVRDDDGGTLFVAQNRQGNLANVLVERSNLNSGCLLFLASPRPMDASPSPEVIEMYVPTDRIKASLAQGSTEIEIRNRVPVFYNHRGKSLHSTGDMGLSADNVISMSGICTKIADAADAGATGFGAWFIAHAQDTPKQELMPLLTSPDPFTRWDARTRIAMVGPGAIPQLMGAFPAEGAPGHDLYAFSAAAALARMAPAHPTDEIRAKLSADDIARLVDLLGQDDRELRENVNAFLIALQDDRASFALLNVIDRESADGATRDLAAETLGGAVFQMSPEARETLAAQLNQRLESQRMRGPDADATATRGFNIVRAKTQSTEDIQGWVLLGALEGSAWSERRFQWGDAGLPIPGAQIVATSNVSLREDASRFELSRGWENSEIKGLVRAGDALNVIAVVPVVPGIYWAQVSLTR